VLIAFEDARILALEHLLLDALLDDGVDLFLGGPQLRQHHGLPVRCLPNRFFRQVLVHGAGQRERDDQGR